jgi:hypothetical protein
MSFAPVGWLTLRNKDTEQITFCQPLLLDRITVDGYDHAVIGVGVLRDQPLPEGKVVAVLDMELLFVGQGVPTR